MTPTAPQPTVTRHPPEHSTQDNLGPPEVLPAGCCSCCCCCCCLHTMGGIGGAVMGSATHIATGPAQNTDPRSPFRYRFDVFEEDQPLISPVLLYWLMVVFTVVGTVVVTAVVTYSSGPGLLAPGDLIEVGGIGLLIAAMIFPGLQLVASVLSYLVIAIFYPERGYALKRINRITLYSFLGTLLGLLLLAGCLGIFLIR